MGGGGTIIADTSPLQKAHSSTRLLDSATVIKQDTSMFGSLDELVLYLRLAQAFRSKLQMSDRDRALIMAATAATFVQLPHVADFCRQLILAHNQGHMLRKWESYSHALADDDFGFFLKQVRRKLPIEKAESLLVEMDYQCDVRKEDYSTDEAYAAAVMGVDAQWLLENFG